MEEKSAKFMQILCSQGFWLPTHGWRSHAGAFDVKQTDTRMLSGCGADRSIYNLVRAFD